MIKFKAKSRFCSVKRGAILDKNRIRGNQKGVEFVERLS
jgi:hypothetical protein